MSPTSCLFLFVFFYLGFVLCHYRPISKQPTLNLWRGPEQRERERESSVQGPGSRFEVLGSELRFLAEILGL